MQIPGNLFFRGERRSLCLRNSDRNSRNVNPGFAPDVNCSLLSSNGVTLESPVEQNSAAYLILTRAFLYHIIFLKMYCLKKSCFQLSGTSTFACLASNSSWLHAYNGQVGLGVIL